MDIDLNHLRKIFFSGIGGSGMSALAQVLNQGGRVISGSDRNFDRGGNMQMARKLAGQGIRLAPQDGSGVDSSMDAVVVSAAVEQDTPDYSRAMSLGLRVIPRPDLLAAVVNSRRGMCIAGTSGKSTVTALVAYALTELGFSPSVITGAALENYIEGPTTGNALTGDSDLCVVEACESDGSVVGYRPSVGVLLNIQRDHHEIRDLLPMFERFAAQCSECLILGADCPNTSRLELPEGLPIVRFGIESGQADIRASDIVLEPFSARFRVGAQSFESPLPGRYNVQNVLAALAACEVLGVKRRDFARVLPGFMGISRRFRKVGQARGVVVIDDFAHNPDKIAAVLENFNNWPEVRRKIVVFQPHGYGPTRFFLDELVEVFSKCLGPDDLLVLLEIFYAGGTAVRDISSSQIVERVLESGSGPQQALYFEDRANASAAIAAAAREGDIVLVMGARDPSLTDFCREVVAELRAD
ncbi:MAG: Mur ligase family protein [Gemmatimonadota bacterium]|nr:Mur ligase family protein [Gemmatimonadota bacterium]